MTKSRSEAQAQERLADIEEATGACVGLPPFHSRLAGFDRDRRPVFAVCDRTGATAIECELDPISAQLAAWAATRRSGHAPIACLWHPQAPRG